MTVIDVNAKAKSLGISYSAFISGMKKIYVPFYNVKDEASEGERVAPLLVLTDEELIAVVRWKEWHKAFPNYLDWNGWIKKPA